MVWLHEFEVVCGCFAEWEDINALLLLPLMFQCILTICEHVCHISRISSQSIGGHLNWLLESLLLFVFCRGAVSIRARVSLPLLNSLRLASLIYQYPAPDSLLRLD